MSAETMKDLWSCLCGPRIRCTAGEAFFRHCEGPQALNDATGGTLRVDEGLYPWVKRFAVIANRRRRCGDLKGSVIEASGGLRESSHERDYSITFRSPTRSPLRGMRPAINVHVYPGCPRDDIKNNLSDIP